MAPVSRSQTTSIKRPPKQAAADEGRSRLGDFTRPIPVDKRISRRPKVALFAGLGVLAIVAVLGAAIFILPIGTWRDQDVDLTQRQAELDELEKVNGQLDRRGRPVADRRRDPRGGPRGDRLRRTGRATLDHPAAAPAADRSARRLALQRRHGHHRGPPGGPGTDRDRAAPNRPPTEPAHRPHHRPTTEPAAGEPASTEPVAPAAD